MRRQRFNGRAFFSVLAVVASSLVAAIILFFLLPASLAHADVPLAARLLAIPYNDSTSGGLRVSVTGASLSLRGITNDGTTVYLLNSNGNIVTIPMSSITGSPGGTVSIAGTAHTVGWNQGGIPAFGNADGRSLAYSHGCLFINDDTSASTPSPISLYCIDITDWSVTKITVPTDEPLPPGHSWGRGTMIDFSDGRIGKVSAYAATTTPTSGYTSYLRMYTVTGTGKDATIAWSHDYYTHDTENWNTDEHGVATDGTYLYRIEFIGSHLASGDFKSWPLDPDTEPDPIYAGLYTVPDDGGAYNVTYLSHDHTGNRYMIGGYSTNHFYITSAADPGPGPGNALTPVFGSISYSTHGFTVQVTNYDSSFTWGTSTSAGTMTLDGTGLVTVTGLAGEGSTATVTLTTQHTNVPDGTGQITGTIPDLTPPVITDVATSSVSDTAATITWGTAEQSSSEVVYSADFSYGSSTGETDTSPRVSLHTVALEGLLACTLYNFEVVSTDAAGNYATSTASSFMTSGCSGSVSPTSATTTTILVSAPATSTITDSGRTLSVDAPANFTATSSSVVIQIKGLQSAGVLESIGIPGGLQSAASVVFDVKALIDNSTLLDSFDLPVTITYAYTDADVSGLNESSLTMYHYHNGAWLPLDNCLVNTGANTITCTTPSFSTFAIFGTRASVSSSSSSNLKGNSVKSEVAYLTRIGMFDQANALKKKWYWLFPSETVAPVASATVSSRILHMGMSGNDVVTLQKFLIAHGYAIVSGATGYFGAQTRSALIAYQKAHNIIPSIGNLGSKTRAYIKQSASVKI